MISLDITKFEIELRNHVFIRADERNIDLEFIYTTIKSGKIKRFGKNNLRFEKKFKHFELVCIGQIRGIRLTVLTVYKKQ